MTKVTKDLSLRLTKAVAQVVYLPRTLQLVWKATHGWSIGWIALLIAQGALPVVTVYLSRSIVNNLAIALRDGGPWRPVLDAAVIMAGVMLLGEVFRSASGWIRTVQAELVQDHISSLIQQKSVAVDLAFYDSADFYDHLHRARVDACSRPIALLESLGALAQNAITLVAMFGLLVRYGPSLPFALAASTMPAIFVVLRYTLRQHEWRLRMTADERRTWYYEWLLTTPEAAAELRLFGLGDHFRSAYRRVRARLRQDRIDMAKKQSVAELEAGVGAYLITGTALGFIVWKAARGLLTLGDLALIYQALQQGMRLMRNSLDSLGHLYSNSLFLSNLFEFLALEPRVIDPMVPRASKTPNFAIRFTNVSFRYPGTDRFALQNFSILIPDGQFAAIVGLNGAGKSTLLKLLCRLYDPDVGNVQIGGIDLRDLTLSGLRSMLTVLFQQPVHYNDTVFDNISFGNLGYPQRSDVESACEAAEADEIIQRLPEGLSTLLGRSFAEGTELSTGEWQRVALARTFLRQAPILLLDEPTSAMDPWAEASWLERFRNVCARRTAVLITHRLTTAMRADVIHVMADGRIVESGSHDELLENGGLYAQSWATQRDRELVLERFRSA